ncbi:RNA polymerase sigma factor FecI [Yersinia entomophaga]|uniref:RNA polymerase sigma factor n=2 Tax=Yersiniaceae TaxID=1903411 RepID=A0ABN4PW11_YERET|nr:ferric citrate uptake sigma factor FecI [Yersinia entomophaga]ANI30080.1 RNA polymerase sigma factor FecI [Yersinia entomophaga]OWF84840.1 RNA polymerase subunit sigma [Yersinia entomophaga]
MSTLAGASPSASFEALYSSHHHWLRNWLRSKLGSTYDADDLAQDTFMGILVGNKAHEIREPKSFLCTVARRVMIDYFRRNALERAYLEMLAQMPEVSVTSPEQRQCLLETLQQIDTMLDGLGHKVRQAFLMSQLEGLTYPVIAERLQISVISVKKYMAKATEHCLLFALEHPQTP